MRYEVYFFAKGVPHKNKTAIKAQVLTTKRHIQLHPLGKQPDYYLHMPFFRHPVNTYYILINIRTICQHLYNIWFVHSEGM